MHVFYELNEKYEKCDAMTPHIMEVFGTVKVGERGQIVVPSSARKSLDIKPGDYLLVLSAPSREGLALIKVEIVRNMIQKMSTGLARPRKTSPRSKSGRRK